MKALTTLLFSVLLVLSAVFVGAQSVVPVVIEHVELDDVNLEAGDINRLDIERGEQFDLELKILAFEDVDDVEIRVFVSGFEYSDVSPIGAHIGPFDFDANVTYIKRMKLTFPDEVDVDNYQLRVVISDRNGMELVSRYSLLVDTKRHDLKIEDVVLSPSNSVKAGQALLATVRLENKGQRDEDDVKVTVSIPGLGVSNSDYIDEIDNGDDEEETEEIFLKLPRCAEPGVYDVTVQVLYNEGHDRTSASSSITVLENEDCKPEAKPVVVVQQSAQNATAPVVADSSSSKVRSALEVILLVLVALLVIVGLIIGFTRMRSEE